MNLVGLSSLYVNYTVIMCYKKIDNSLTSKYAIKINTLGKCDT